MFSLWFFFIAPGRPESPDLRGGRLRRRRCNGEFRRLARSLPMLVQSASSSQFSLLVSPFRLIGRWVHRKGVKADGDSGETRRSRSHETFGGRSCARRDNMRGGRAASAGAARLALFCMRRHVWADPVFPHSEMLGSMFAQLRPLTRNDRGCPGSSLALACGGLTSRFSSRGRLPPLVRGR